MRYAVGRVGAVGPVDAVEALVTGALDPSPDRSVAHAELPGDSPLGVAAPDGCDDVAASDVDGLFLLISVLSGMETAG